MAENMGEALGWEGEGQVTESKDFEVLPEGEYDFEVTNLKRERHGGSANIGPCPVAVLQLKCKGQLASGTVFERLYLNTKVLWKISNFFKCVGIIAADTPEGTRMPMSLFDQVIGCTGRCKIKPSKYTKDGKEYDSNDVDFIVPKATQQAPATTYQPQQTAYQPQQTATPPYAQPQPPAQGQQGWGWQ